GDGSEGVELGGRRVRHQQVVRLVDGLERSDRGGVEADALLEQVVVELAQRDGEVLPESGHVDEPEVHDLHALFLGQLQDVAWGHSASFRQLKSGAPDVPTPRSGQIFPPNTYNTPTVRVDCDFLALPASVEKNAAFEKSRRYSSRVMRAFAIVNSLVRVNSCTFWLVPVMNASSSFSHS